MSRTGENIYQRKDGRFEGRYIASRDENGKPKYKAVYGKSKAEVRDKLEKARQAMADGEACAGELTFGQMAAEWLSSIREQVAVSTYDRYVEVLERDIYPEYADTPMEQVTWAELNRFMAIAPTLAEKNGRTLKYNALQVVRTVMGSVIRYAAERGAGKAEMEDDTVSYEALSTEEIGKLCAQAKHHHSQEMLAALLFLFCGLRNGEICALSCDDIDLERMEIYIHSTAQRVRNPDREAANRTVLMVREISRKNQKRRVRLPEVLKEYIGEFMEPGCYLLRTAELSVTDPRTFENRLNRAMEAMGLARVNSERLRMTFQKGKAEEEILTNTFLGIRPDRPYSGSLDVKWLTDEMTRDLAPLRMLVGLSCEEMGQLLGVSVSTYLGMESGKRGISWAEYMTLLFLFRYNGRTIGIVDELGLFPQSLKEKIRIGN